jgi:tetratricopeptide (TPR) repeat protein
MTASELILAGHRARREGHPENAKDLFVQAFTSTDSIVERADALRGHANAESDLGAFTKAAKCYRDASALLRGLDEPLRLAHTVRHLGDVLRRAGRTPEALPSYEEALRIYRDHPEAAPLDVGNTLRGYGLLLEGMGDRERAREAWAEALRIYREAGVWAGIKQAHWRIAGLGGS